MAENYWPISLTCICNKIVEHIMISNIMNHFDQHQILSNLQHGFREGHSCEIQLIAFVDDLAKEMQNGGKTDAIVMDFSKMFDITALQTVRLRNQQCNLNLVKKLSVKQETSVVLEGQCLIKFRRHRDSHRALFQVPFYSWPIEMTSPSM